MINSQKSFNLHEYIDIFLKRKRYFVIPLVLALAGTLVYLASTPRWYRSSALVLVMPQKISPDYVKATVTSGVEERLASISQEILSQTRLEQVIREFKLYPSQVKSKPMEVIVESMRKDINIQTPKNEKEKNYFTISYVGKDPRMVASVTNKLVALFTEENLRMRKQQAQGTSEFLESELKAKRKEVEKAQQEITEFKRRFINELPENRDANLKVLEQLNLQSQKINELIKAAEDRKLIIQNQTTSVTFKGLEAGHEGRGQFSGGLRSPLMVQLSQLKGHLEELQARYTASHPDIVITKKKIADLEKKLAESSGGDKATENSQKGKSGDPVQDQYNLFQSEQKTQLAVVDRETNRLKKEDERTRAMISQYQARIEGTPIRELSLSAKLRDFNSLNETYQSLLKKSADAQQAENLEQRQKGEQFRVVDPARVPEKPYKPDVNIVLLIGLVLGLGSGLGITFIREQLDRSFRDAEDLEVTLGLRVMANIPKFDKKAA
jgi:polysaccharide chain length determinant protein (PEP-CTERM system associated)